MRRMIGVLACGMLLTACASLGIGDDCGVVTSGDPAVLNRGAKAITECQQRNAALAQQAQAEQAQAEQAMRMAAYNATATEAARPTATPLPTMTPLPTHTPEPTTTPIPTATHTPEPTITPLPTPTATTIVIVATTRREGTSAFTATLTLFTVGVIVIVTLIGVWLIFWRPTRRLI